MKFRTKRYEYRLTSTFVYVKDGSIADTVYEWQRRKPGGNWLTVPKRFWKRIRELRQKVISNRRPKLSENIRIHLTGHNNQTKKTTKWAYKYGVPLENLIT
jgi:hypothetical protein